MWLARDLGIFLTLVLTVTYAEARNLSPYVRGQNSFPYDRNEKLLRTLHKDIDKRKDFLESVPRPKSMSWMPSLRLASTISADTIKNPQRYGHKVDAVVCDICPSEVAISPCTCVCHNTTAADIQCGSSLTSCTRLTEILNVATPISHYFRLVVKETQLQCTLENSMWGPPTFQEIILNENLFSTLDNHAFSHFNATLKILNLERNRLQNVYFQTLSDQPLLEHLILSNNDIMFIPGEGGIILNKLKDLRLYNNSLTSINSKTFEYMPRLELLDLSKNVISNINSEAFSFQNRVTNSHELFINLAYNQIQDIPFDMISGVETVTINLQNNYIRSLPQDRYLSILENTNFQAKLIVSGNPIVCDQELCWLTRNATMSSCFDNFRCSNIEVSFSDLTTEDLGC